MKKLTKKPKKALKNKSRSYTNRDKEILSEDAYDFLVDIDEATIRDINTLVKTNV